MICTRSLYEACQKLFTDYPLATRIVSRDGTVRSMVLMLQDEDYAGFFVLSGDYRNAKQAYSVWSWPAGDIVAIEIGNEASVPVPAATAVTCGVPIPHDGSLFGWTYGDVISSLIVIYAEYSAEYPEPGWAVMPLTSASEELWPPFTGEPLFGHWSWREYKSRSIVSLDRVIAETPEAVYWVDTKDTLGSDCCAVARDISPHEGVVLRRGRYVYYEALQTGEHVPSLTELLANPGALDLTPRFRLYRQRLLQLEENSHISQSRDSV
jgi:hypothetical protein